MESLSARTMLSARELAQRWTLSEKTLERWRMQGTGPKFIKLGSRVLYPLIEIAAHESARTRNSTAGRTSALHASC